MRRDKGAEKDNSIWGSYEREKKLEEEKLWAEKEEKHYHGMFEEDRAGHHMTKKKERAIIIIVIIVALAIAVTFFIMRLKWQRSILARYMASPGRPAYSDCLLHAPSRENRLL